MKKNNSYISRRKGVTLIELTVVILVLLTLISILFIGARAWQAGARRAQCILNQRNVQQAMRSMENLDELVRDSTASGTTGSPVTIDSGTSNSDLVSRGFLSRQPVNPDAADGITYAPSGTTIPAEDTVLMQCSFGGAPYTTPPAGAPGTHEPRVYLGW